MRDWLHVDDHCPALDLLLERGEPGETYNIGGGTEVASLELRHSILKLLGKPESLVQPVKDRPGHDRRYSPVQPGTARYSLDTTKLGRLGWTPKEGFPEGLARTVEWYKTHDAWAAHQSGSPEYREFYRAHYGQEQARRSDPD